MSSVERLALKGKLVELQETEKRLRIKIGGTTNLLKGYLYEIEFENILKFDENNLSVFAYELVETIAKLKELNSKIEKVKNELE